MKPLFYFEKQGPISCKLDIEKVYGHVDWSFLCSILDKIDFGRKCGYVR